MAYDKDFLGQKPIRALLFRLALPSVVAQVVNMFYNIVDRIYVGHIPGYGTLALSSLGICMPLIMIVSAFAAFVSAGGAPLASISMGQKNYRKAESILGNCFSLLICLSLIITCILLFFNAPLLRAFGASDKTLGYALEYMNIYACGTVFVQLTLGLNMFITAQGFAKTGMITVLIGAALNIVLDPFFIFVLQMGVKGAALATIISQATSSLWCLAFLFGKKTAIKIKAEFLALKKDIIIPSLSLGAATFMMNGSDSIIAVCYNSSLQQYGGDIAVGAMSICLTTMQFALLPLQGVGQGAQPILSYNFGAKNAARVKETFILLLTVCLVYSGLLYFVIMLFPQFFAGIFSADRYLISYTSSALRIYCAVLCIFGIQIACQHTFTSIGNARSSILVAVVRKFVLLLPLIYLLPKISALRNKEMAVFLAEPIADIFAVTFTAILFFVQFRKALSSIK